MAPHDLQIASWSLGEVTLYLHTRHHMTLSLQVSKSPWRLCVCVRLCRILCAGVIVANEACINIPCVGTVTAGDTIEAAALSLSIRVSSPRALKRDHSTSHSAAAASRVFIGCQASVSVFKFGW